MMDMEKKRVDLFKRDCSGKMIPCGHMEHELALVAGYKQMDMMEDD
jgi:hypothetical protein